MISMAAKRAQQGADHHLYFGAGEAGAEAEVWPAAAKGDMGVG
jgi:hypothetical protein